ncbi:calcium-binding protein [Cypionkella sinensis]|uniref:Calcium-binding protein n=1 Tax=Cypionkella sinensis TaxID=1756043 RepID=A0ABV7J3E4_9RHOB
MGGVVEPVVEPVPVTATISGTSGNDTLTGTSGADTIIGLAGNDVLFGGGGGDSLYGGDGDDYLVYRPGGRLFGGAGIDTAYFDLSARNAGIKLNSVTVGSPLAGFEALSGKLTAFDDTLFAGALGGPDARGPSYIYSGPSLYAGAGQDSLVLNYSSLTIAERVVFVTSSSIVTAGVFTNTNRLGSANLYDFEILTLYGSRGNDYVDLSNWVGGTRSRLYGGAGDDDLRAGAIDSNLLYGGDGNDTFVAKSGNGAADRLFGGAGNDAFWSVTGQDQVFGGAGVDEVILDLSASTTGVSIGKNIGALYSDVENYYGKLTKHADTVRLVWAATAFTGSSGLLDAGAGTDTLVLDFGHITSLGYAGVSSSGTGGGGNFDVTLFGSNGGLSDSLNFVGFEHISLLGSGGNDSLHGVDLAETLRGRDGDDWITGGRFGDLLDGGAGNDTLQGDSSGSPGAGDTLYGGSGDGQLDGEAGNDLLFGGDGNDGLFGGSGDVRAYGGSGDDTLAGWDGNDLLSGGSGNDSIDADVGRDTLLGGLGDDWLGGGFGSDWLAGVEGNDSLYGDTGFDEGGGADSLYGGYGDDLLSGDGGSDLLYGGYGNDVLIGGSEFAISIDDDSLFGGSGDDKLFGFDGKDSLSGGSGNDILRGGNGDDVMTGGTGVDRFVFDFDNYSSEDHDTITDYTAQDVISFANHVTLNVDDLTITQDGADKLISWSNGSLTLLNYSGAVTFAFSVDQPFS